MATATVKNAFKAKWGGGKRPLDASYGKLMMWFFLLSDIFTFSGLLISYGMVRFAHDAYEGSISDFEFSYDYWPVPDMVFDGVPFLHGVHLPLVFVGIMTFILIMSSVTMVLAVEAGKMMDQEAVQKWLLWTILGGFTFLGCQAWEWSHFIMGKETLLGEALRGTLQPDGTRMMGANLTQNQYGPPAFADFFFFITGFHGFHVFSGVMLNVLAFYQTAFGVYQKRGHYEMVEKIGLYWHFVDLVWVFVFTFFYLV